MIPDLNWFRKIRKANVVPVVVAGENIHSLTYAHVVANFCQAVIVNPCVLANPYVFPNLEKPRILDRNARLADEPGTNLCPEEPQNARFDPSGDETEDQTLEQGH